MLTGLDLSLQTAWNPPTGMAQSNSTKCFDYKTNWIIIILKGFSWPAKCYSTSIKHVMTVDNFSFTDRDKNIKGIMQRAGYGAVCCSKL